MASGLDSDLNDATLKQLQCPVCLGYCTAPIFQCTNGHNICDTCFPNVKICSMCQGPITSVRNLFAESVSAKIKHPCKFASLGCKQRLLLCDLGNHMSNCQFGYKCYVYVRANDKSNQCKWQGAYNNLLAHAQSKHASWVAMGNTIETRFFLRKFQPILIRAHDELFWCFFCNDYSHFSMQMFLFLIGRKKEALKYSYEVKLTSENEECVIINKGSVQSFNDSVVNECKKDESGKNTIVSGKHMVQRFLTNNIFRCSVKINKTA